MNRRSVYAAVIGGGAAGLMCAIRAAERHPDKTIVILEKADRVGKKLLVTGNGRCNLSHIGADSGSYHGEGSGNLINILFENYNTKAVLSCFRTLGLMTRTDSDGRVYPLSNQVSAVLDVLRRRLRELSVDEICDTDIRSIQKIAGGYEITAAELCINAQKLIIAVGGRADYAGRESGSGELLRTLGLRLSKPSPSLSPVNVRSALLRPLKGIRSEATATLLKGGKALKSERGEVQFAENTLSGICVFNLSREANKGGCEISLNLLPDCTGDAVRSDITARVRRNPQAPANEIFMGLFHKNIGLMLLKKSGISPSAACRDISDKEINTLCQTITDCRFVCEANDDFKKAQVTAGGVSLSEINPRTYESKRHRGLYLIGEALDIDGDCGGYNLQFAFASGMCAGDSL